jgi:hypothetical protein
MPVVRCPRCGRKVKCRRIQELPTFPFCSERCRLLDLGNWLDERYRISEPLEDVHPIEKDEEPEEAERPEDGSSKERKPASD